MDEFELIKSYFQKISNNNPHAKNLKDDVYFDKISSPPTYTNFPSLTASEE